MGSEMCIRDSNELEATQVGGLIEIAPAPEETLVKEEPEDSSLIEEDAA